MSPDSFPPHLLSCLRNCCTIVSRKFASRGIATDGSEIVGEVYLNLRKLSNTNASVFTDESTFRAVARARAKWAVLKLLRVSPWGNTNEWEDM